MKAQLIRAGLGAVLILGLAFGGGAAPAAYAAATDDTQAAAEAVFTKVVQSEDPAEALVSLSASDQELFDLWTTPVVTVESTTYSRASASSAVAAAAASCSNYTQRGYFTNQVGSKLGDFWTTGQACRSGNKVTSVKLIDGGGKTSAFGWSYSGRTVGKGISTSRNTGYVYGQYTFKLQAGDVVIQQPSYCARTVHTLGANTGDGRCGLS